MFFLRRPDEESLAAMLARARRLPFSYPHVGLARESAPPGFRVAQERAVLGHGEAVFARARRGLEEWRQFDLGWAGIYPATSPIQVGREVLVVARHLGFWSVHACRIAYRLGELGARDSQAVSWDAVAPPEAVVRREAVVRPDAVPGTKEVTAGAAGETAGFTGQAAGSADAGARQSEIVRSAGSDFGQIEATDVSVAPGAAEQGTGATTRVTIAGFAYGTLTEHAEIGEEIFQVAMDHASGEVTYLVRAVSRERAVLARIGFPIARVLQDRFRRDSGRALQRYVAQGNAG